MKARAAVILIQDEKIALIERHRQGLYYFVFPGGKVEAGETPAQAAARETKEELGFDVSIGSMVANVWYQGSPQYYFLARYTGGQFGHGSGTEMTSAPGSKKGTYQPVWIDLALISSIPLLPKMMAELVLRSLSVGWPDKPLVVTDAPPDEAENDADNRRS